MLFEYSFIYIFITGFLSSFQSHRKPKTHCTFIPYIKYLLYIWWGLRNVSYFSTKKNTPHSSLHLFSFQMANILKYIYVERTLFAYGVVRHHSHTLRSILENEKKPTTTTFNKTLFHFSHSPFKQYTIYRNRKWITFKG